MVNLDYFRNKYRHDLKWPNRAPVALHLPKLMNKQIHKYVCEAFYVIVIEQNKQKRDRMTGDLLSSASPPFHLI